MRAGVAPFVGALVKSGIVLAIPNVGVGSTSDTTQFSWAAQ